MRWRWALVFLTQIVFYGLPWLQWGQRQMVLFDLGARRFYLFGLVLYPQDFIYLTGLLIICALALFLFTAVAGRLWCGFAARRRSTPRSSCGSSRRSKAIAARASAWTRGLDVREDLEEIHQAAAVDRLSVWTGFTFVGYFVPIRELGVELLALQGGWQIFWVLFYGFATYGNAGYMREQVCKYMCPYARFQSAMFDKDTLIVSYDPVRGEPAARARRMWTTRPRAWATASTASSACRCARGHRHPQRPAVRVHWLRPVHRCVQQHDGQDALPARPDPPDRRMAWPRAGSMRRSCAVCCARVC
jgi:cytochrome c oxidase accessory protein FixG